MNEKLHELTSAMKAIEKADGMDQEAYTNYMDGLEMQTKEKAENMLKLIVSKDAATLGIDAEIERLQKLKEGIQNKQNSIKGYITYCMEKDSIQKIETPLGTFTLRESKAVDIVDEKAIPEDYMVEKTTRRPDKVGIRRVLNGGGEIQGATFKYNKSLIIK